MKFFRVTWFDWLLCPDGLGLVGVGWILVVGLPGEGGTATGSAEAVGHEGSQAPAPAQDPGDIYHLPPLLPQICCLVWGGLGHILIYLCVS